jgi:hypothetical protein
MGMAGTGNVQLQCSALLPLPYLNRRGVASGLAGLLPIWNAGLSSGKL